MSTRGQRPHPQWRKVRAAILERDNHQCRIREPGCTGTATTVDHIISLARLGIHRSDPRSLDPANLTAACTHCHDLKTRRETSKATAQSNIARATARRQRLTLHRPHPGDVT